MDFDRSCASATKSRSAAGKRPVDTGEEVINIGDILFAKAASGQNRRSGRIR